jgi:hypothetical protein
MKKHSILALVATLLVSATALADIAVFKEIADEAPVGNGSTSVGRYNRRQSKAAVVAKGLAELKRERWESCGPWKVIDSRRSAIRAIEKLEEDQEVTTTASKLEALYKDDKIVAIVGNISNTEIECSLSFFNVYGKDGSVLKLRYSMGD